MSQWVAVVVGAVAGYLFGGIPFGLLVGRLAGVGDLRDRGSGKTGFTNSLRTMGLKWALIVVVGDITKGAAAVILDDAYFPEVMDADSGERAPA